MDIVAGDFKKIENRIARYIYKKYISDTMSEYKLFMEAVFILERQKYRILQEDIKDELNIENRCTYIRRYKHRYYRCKNKVFDDCDTCKKHIDCKNIYLDCLLHH